MVTSLFKSFSGIYKYTWQVLDINIEDPYFTEWMHSLRGITNEQFVYGLNLIRSAKTDFSKFPPNPPEFRKLCEGYISIDPRPVSKTIEQWWRGSHPDSPAQKEFAKHMSQILKRKKVEVKIPEPEIIKAREDRVRQIDKLLSEVKLTKKENLGTSVQMRDDTLLLEKEEGSNDSEEQEKSFGIG